MRYTPRTTLIGIALLALAMLNLNLVEGIGVGLVRDVEAKYLEMGADWILVEYNSWWSPSSAFDPAASARAFDEEPGVLETLSFWYAMDFHLGEKDPPVPLRVVLAGEGLSFEEHPYVFIPLQGGGGQIHRVKFAREPLTLDSGRFPSAPGEVAVDSEAARRLNVSAGDTLPFRHQPGGAVFSDSGTGWGYIGEPVPFGDVTVTGVVHRGRLGNEEENHPLVLAAHDPRLAAAIQADRIQGFVPGSFVAVRTGLDDVAALVPRLEERVKGMGLTVEVWEPSWLPDEKDPRKTVGARMAEPAAPKHVSILTDHDLVSEATDAAARAGRWYRFLAVGGLLLAALGVAFTAAAALRRTRLQTGVRQAVGFSTLRLYGRCVAHAAGSGAVGGALGALAAAAFVASGLSARLLGVSQGIDLPRFLLIGVLTGAALHVLAAVPIQAAVLRAAPAHNLREATR